MPVGRPMYRITLNFLRFLSRLFSFPSQYASCFSAFKRPGKKSGVTTFSDGNDSSDPSDPELEFDFEDDYEIISLKGFRTLESELKRALAELDLKKGEVRLLDDKEKKGREELADITQKLASVTGYLELLVEEMEKKKSEFTTTMGRLQEENRGLVQQLQEQTSRADSLMTELTEVKAIAATREKDIGVLQSRLNGSLSTVESQSADLANIRALLPQSDTVVDTDAIKLVGRLNAEIFQAAALLAEACSSVKGRPLQDIDNRTASTRVKEMFGTKFVDLVQNVPHENNPAVLRIAFQACIVVFADWVSAAWHFQADPAPQFFGEVYRNVWLDEGQAAAGHWRAQTRKHIQKLLDPNPDGIRRRFIMHISDSLADVVLCAGIHNKHDQMSETIIRMAGDRISTVVEMALKLNRMLGEEVTAADVETTWAHAQDIFDPNWMEDDYGNWKSYGARMDLKVMCTTDLGLRRLVKADNEVGWVDTVLVKPKVILEEILSSSPIEAK
ncbi:hypothetical protein BDM02DRAFT_3111268 [Thelephora ganbajun]|uniref:Uncharacterized protein n=1 Tax=Thelephora ganbajun TaxID=370292 RepID=A0ACB6ZN66_THEGA|nr:hypothetical protein BDM02DRAFT_3111268 [Thelephora ganbajun]